PDGTYTIEYTICETANTDNCDTATVSVQVGPEMDNVIDAVDDSYNVDTAASGVILDSNVLGNDTVNGAVVAPEDVVITATPTDVLILNVDGSVNVAPGTPDGATLTLPSPFILSTSVGSVTVPPRTPDGTYTIEYTICEVVNVENCDTATV